MSKYCILISNNHFYLGILFIWNISGLICFCLFSFLVFPSSHSYFKVKNINSIHMLAEVNILQKSFIENVTCSCPLSNPTSCWWHDLGVCFILFVFLFTETSKNMVIAYCLYFLTPNVAYYIFYFAIALFFMQQVLIGYLFYTC